MLHKMDEKAEIAKKILEKKCEEKRKTVQINCRPKLFLMNTRNRKKKVLITM